METKRCSRCGEEREISQFNKDKRKYDGLNCHCKSCRKITSKEYYDNNKEEVKQRHQEYYERNKEEAKQRQREYYARPDVKERTKLSRQSRNARPEVKEQIKQFNKIYREEHKEELKQSNQKWRYENKEELKQYRRDYYLENQDKIKLHSQNYQAKPEVKKRTKQYHQKYCNENKEILRLKKKIYHQKPEVRQRVNEWTLKRLLIPENRLMQNIGTSLRHWLKAEGAIKTCRTSEYVCMSKKEFRNHFESLFTEGMTWEKVLSGEIHIDHIRPKSSFNAKDPEEVKKCWHYSNLQPLWAKDNLSKHDKYSPPELDENQ